MESMVRWPTNIPKDEHTEVSEIARMQDSGQNGQKLLMNYFAVPKGKGKPSVQLLPRCCQGLIDSQASEYPITPRGPCKNDAVVVTDIQCHLQFYTIQASNRPPQCIQTRPPASARLCITQKSPASLSDSSKPISHQHSFQMKEDSFAITRTARRVVIPFVFIHDVIPSHSRELCLLQYTPQLRISWVDELERL